MISCSEYDYIEIVCLYHYPIKLTMASGEVIEGKALNTKYNDQRQECILLSVDGNEVMVVLDGLSSLEVCIDNPHFKTVSFT